MHNSRNGTVLNFYVTFLKSKRDDFHNDSQLSSVFGSEDLARGKEGVNGFKSHTKARHLLLTFFLIR